jgi:hypothetical protein
MPRMEIALVYTDGRKEVVSVGRPADLIAFADEFEKLAPTEPYAVRELAWLAHRALKVEQPLDEWVEGLDELTGADDEIAAMRAELAQADPPAEPEPVEADVSTDGYQPTTIGIGSPE